MGLTASQDAERIKANVDAVRRRIETAAARVGRPAADITLVAVSKTATAELIELARAAGVSEFGENRVQDWRRKADVLAVHWHFVGHLQRNKVGQVVGRVGLIHSVDSLALAEAISKKAVSLGLVQPVLIEVNVAGEPTKHGFTPGELETALDAVTQLPGLEVRGLMTMAPLGADPEAVRPVFRQLRSHLEAACQRFPSWRLDQLSMGMTDDFEVAVEEGATIVRIGRAIFG